MLEWLVGNCRVLGISGQNWMLVVLGALAIYIVTLLLMRRRMRLP